MTTEWGYRLAYKPTQKCFKNTNFQLSDGAALHDASYFHYIQLISENFNGIQLFLQKFLKKDMGSDLRSPFYMYF